MKLNALCSFILFWLSSSQPLACQDLKSAESLFANIPILQSSKKWLDFIANEKNLGIDSAKGSFVFSSLKNKTGITGAVFNEATRVNLITNKNKIRAGNQTFLDTIESITVLGIFDYSKDGRKKEKQCFGELITLLKKYYTKKSQDLLAQGDSYFFHEGINEKFPPITLTRRSGWENHNRKGSRYYYIALTYDTYK